MWGGGWRRLAYRMNHSNTLMGTKTPITETASELAAPFASHTEGYKGPWNVPLKHRTEETDIRGWSVKDKLHWAGMKYFLPT